MIIPAIILLILIFIAFITLGIWETIFAFVMFIVIAFLVRFLLKSIFEKISGGGNAP